MVCMIGSDDGDSMLILETHVGCGLLCARFTLDDSYKYDGLHLHVARMGDAYITQMID